MTKLTLEAARVNAGLTQNEAAKKLGINKCTLVNYEKNRSFPTVPIIKRMEKLYSVEYKDIFFGE